MIDNGQQVTIQSLEIHTDRTEAENVLGIWARDPLGGAAPSKTLRNRNHDQDQGQDQGRDRNVL